MRSTLVRRFLFVLLLAPLWMLLSDAARAQSPENESDSLYLGSRVMLTTSEPLQLTLNASIKDFAWSPDGRSIAYWGDSKDGLESSISVIRSSGGQPRTYFPRHGQLEGSASEPNAFIGAIFGWSPDGVDFAFRSAREDPVTKRGIPVLVIADTVSGALLYPPVPMEGDTTEIEDLYGKWSHEESLFAYVVVGVGEADRQTSHLFVYDAATGESREAMPSVANASFTYWMDGTHLLASGRLDGAVKRTRLILDAVTGQVISTDRPIDHAMFRQPGMTHRLNAGSAGRITLSLLKRRDSAFPDTYTFAPATDAQGKPHRKSVQLWISVLRDASSSAISPLSKAVGKPSAPPQLLIDSFRHPSVDDPSDTSADPIAFAPAPDGMTGRTQIAYLISGDLYLSTISVRAPSVQELIAAGEKLTCPEEQQLALINAKQIGMAIGVYSQDYDAMLPMAENFPDEIAAYTGDASIFQIGDRKFQYLLDGDALKDLGTPSDAELGYFDLPCGRVVLYADGHVQALHNGGKPPAPQ